MSFDNNEVSLMNYTCSANNTKKNNGVEMIFAKQFWDRDIMGSNVVIAIMDTGIDFNHDELKENIAGGYNFTSDYNSDPLNYSDGHGHGTHVAGTIAANNHMFMIGVAPRAKLLIMKTLSNTGNGTVTGLIQAIYYAISWRGEHGERVNIMSMSLGTKVNDPLLHEAIQYAVAKNICVVAAAGNDGDGTASPEFRYPGAYNEVIEVGSVNVARTLSSFSNNNDQLDITAPGENIYSTFINNGYRTLTGTSMAAPFVAGSLALLLEEGRLLFKRELMEAELYAQLIKSTSLLFGNPLIEGNGLLNLSKSFG